MLEGVMLLIQHSGDLLLGGIDSGTVQSRLTIHENGNMYHQRLNSSGSLQYHDLHGGQVK